MPENNCQEAWHKVAKRNVAKEMRGSTEKCLEMTIPKITQCDGIRMPTYLSYELHAVSTPTLQKAKLIADDADKCIFSDTYGKQL